MNFWNGINLLAAFGVRGFNRGGERLRICGDSRTGHGLPLLQLVMAFLTALLFAGSPAYAAEPAKSGQGDLRAVEVNITGDSDQTRFVLTLSGPVEARAFLLERPDRVIVDLPQVAFNLPAADETPEGKKPATLVSSYRYGLFAQGRSRIVIDLKEPALATKVVNEAATHGTILTIELTKADRATYSRAAMQPMVEAAAALSQTENARVAAARASATAAEERDNRPLIMLDPGHGGVDPGAMRFGLQEKDLVYDFAQRFRDRIEATGRYRVQMTRNDDSFVSLGGRVRIAREAKADLLISIHADSLSRNSTVRGATVYTSSNTPTDAESAQLAAKENLADQIAGVEVEEDTDDVVGILAELTRRETRTLSSYFADGTIEVLRKEVHLTRNPHRSAGFIVLRAPDVPSVLIELGYISSEQDVALLTSEEWQGKTITALLKALDKFFARQIAQQQTDSG